MSAGNGSAPQRDAMMDNIIIFMVLGVILWIAVWLAWKYQHDAMLSILFASVGTLAKAIQYVPFLYPDEISGSLGNWSRTLVGLDTEPYGWPTAKLMIQTLTHTLTLIFFPLVCLRLIALRRHFIINRFTRNFNLHDLKAARAKDYAAVASVQHENLLKTPLFQGPWAVNRSPIDFALLNHLVVTHKKSVGEAALEGIGAKSKKVSSRGKPIKGWTEKKMRWSVKERRRVLPSPHQCRLDVQATDKLLRQQLGKPLSLENMDKFERCVLAILLTAAVDNIKAAEKLALRLALSFKRLDKNGKHAPVIDDTGIDDICRKHFEAPKIKMLRKKHAYVTTFMMALLEHVWEKGIFTTPQFLWLKPVNRTLYFSLCAMGGDRPFAEALGPWAHLMVEQAKGTAITHPCIEAGTDALKQMLFEEEWIGSEMGLNSEIAAVKALEGTNDDQYSPTRGVDLFDPPAPKQA